MKTAPHIFFGVEAIRPTGSHRAIPATINAPELFGIAACSVAVKINVAPEIRFQVSIENDYDLLTSERELKAALEKVTELEPTESRIRLAETLEQTYLQHEAKEQQAAEIGTS